MYYHDGRKLRVGDIFTTIYHVEIKNWKIIKVVDSDHIIIEDIETQIRHRTDYDSDIDHWRLVSRGNKTTTGFGKFIKKIET